MKIIWSGFASETHKTIHNYHKEVADVFDAHKDPINFNHLSNTRQNSVEKLLKKWPNKYYIRKEIYL